MGLLLLQLLLRAGAGPVAVVDRAAARLEVARVLGAEVTAGGADELENSRFDVAIDATGVPSAIETAFGLLDRGEPDFRRCTSRGHDRGLAVPRLQRRDHCRRVDGHPAQLRRGRRHAHRGAVDPGPLLTSPLPLEGFGAAVGNVRAGQGIKWHIAPS